VQQSHMERGLGEHGLAWTEIAVKGHDDLFAQRVNRWICDLGKTLVKVIRDGTSLRRERGEGRVVAHAPYRVFAFC